jgi:hypothetical protein
MRNMQAIDAELLHRARELSGLREKAAVLNAGLQALIARENARRLIALGGTQRKAVAGARRRSRITK